MASFGKVIFTCFKIKSQLLLKHMYFLVCLLVFTDKGKCPENSKLCLFIGNKDERKTNLKRGKRAFERNNVTNMFLIIKAGVVNSSVVTKKAFAYVSVSLQKKRMSIFLVYSEVRLCIHKS